MATIKKQMMLQGLLAKLIRERGKVCLTVILPLHFTATEVGMKNHSIRQAIDEAIDQLLLLYPTDVLSLQQKLNVLLSKVKPEPGHLGIGIYLSESIQEFISFPFIVEEKIYVSDHFDLPDLLYLIQYMFPFYVLYLNDRSIRLFAGNLSSLSEVVNDRFSIDQSIEIAGTYSHITISPSEDRNIKSPESTRHFTKSRVQLLTHEIDVILNKYIQDKDLLLLCGEKRHTAAFLNRSIHINKVISVINGNYDQFSLADFSLLIVPTLHAYINEQQLDELSELREKNGEGKAVYGIVSVWNAVIEERANTLLMEKDYELDLAGKKHILQQLNHYTSTKNNLGAILNKLIEAVLKQKGRIVFVENEMLRTFRNIALITNY